MEHPFDGSLSTDWSLADQPSGPLADFAALLTPATGPGCGHLDWVPGFSDDPHGLAGFDGTALYSTPTKAGSASRLGYVDLQFWPSRGRKFLISNAVLADCYGIDGLRADAVASMLYLDYSRPPGDCANRHGGRENLEAIEFIRIATPKYFATTGDHHGQESTAWPMVSQPVGGRARLRLQVRYGVDATPELRPKEPIHRKHHHGDVLFGLHYAFRKISCCRCHTMKSCGKRSTLAVCG